MQWSWEGQFHLTLPVQRQIYDALLRAELHSKCKRLTDPSSSQQVYANSSYNSAQQRFEMLRAAAAPRCVWLHIWTKHNTMEAIFSYLTRKRMNSRCLDKQIFTCISPRISRFSMGKRCVEQKVYWGSFGKVVVICRQKNRYITYKGKSRIKQNRQTPEDLFYSHLWWGTPQGEAGLETWHHFQICLCPLGWKEEKMVKTNKQTKKPSIKSSNHVPGTLPSGKITKSNL